MGTASRQIVNILEEKPHVPPACANREKGCPSPPFRASERLNGTEKAKNVTAFRSSEMIALKILKNSFNDWYPPFMHIEESRNTGE